MMVCLEEEIIDRITALVDLSRSLSGALALTLASTSPGEFSADKIDALVDLSYKIHLNLNQLEEIWTQASKELSRGQH